jgi:hypothetical protein
MKNVKLITIIALATLFMTTTTFAATTTAISYSACPCDYSTAFLFAKNQVKKIGGSFVIGGCYDDVVNSLTLATGYYDGNNNNTTCFVGLSAQYVEGVYLCGYEFDCEEVTTPEDPPLIFTLVFSKGDNQEQGLSPAQFDACRKKIEYISNLHGVECTQ